VSKKRRNRKRGKERGVEKKREECVLIKLPPWSGNEVKKKKNTERGRGSGQVVTLERTQVSRV
jgi:hypothetical protein